MDNLKKKSFEVPTLTRLALTLPLTQAVSHASLKASCILKLRDHPLMTRKSGFKNWPPAWTTRRLDESTKPTDEIGILEMPLRPQRFTNRLFLFIVHGGFRYIASMAFDDPAFRDELYRLLKSNIGPLDQRDRRHRAVVLSKRQPDKNPNRRKGDSACQLKPLRTLESKQLKLSVTAANKSLRGFEAKSLSLDFMT
jgi:hypothetical protein